GLTRGAEEPLEPDVAGVRAQRRVEDRTQHFAATVEIALHQVGAADEHRRVAAVLEPEHARMLEEASDDRADGDAVADAGNAGPQAADAANDEVDPHARLRRAIQPLDDFAVGQAVQLDDDAQI